MRQAIIMFLIFAVLYAAGFYISLYARYLEMQFVNWLFG